MSVLEVIAEVYDRKPLWQVNHPQHHNRQIVDKLWDEVADALDCEKSKVKKRWKNLKDKYRKELKLSKGDSGGACLQSDWVFFKLLDFLKDQVNAGKMSGNLEKRHQKAIGDLELLADDRECRRQNVMSILGINSSSEISVPLPVTEPNGLKKEAIADTSCSDGSTPELLANDREHRRQNIMTTLGINSSSEISVPLPETEPNGSKKWAIADNSCSGGSTPVTNPSTENSLVKPNRSQDSSTDKIIELEERKMCYVLGEREAEKDEDYHFFMSLVPHMKNFSSLQKLRVRNRIHNVIIEEMEKTERNSRNQHVGGI